MDVKNVLFHSAILTFTMACGDSDSNSGGSSQGATAQEVKLALTTATHPHVYKDFDNPLDKSNTDLPNQTLTITGTTAFYEGSFHTYDGLKVPVYAALVPGASVDRILIQVNGGTGTDPRYFMNNYNHKAVVMISMRGLHHDDIENEECTLGTGLVDCLGDVSYLKKVNPRDNGRDIADMMNVILGDTGSFTVDGASKDHSFFGVSGEVFNVETGSYGATLFAYAMARSDIPEIGRVFLEGPSAPDEDVITDGFRNGNVALNNLLDTIGFNATEKSTFLDVMKARHTAYNDDVYGDGEACDADISGSTTADCLSSAMIFQYIKGNFDYIAENESAGSDTNTALATLKTALVAIPEAEATGGDLPDVTGIYRSTYVNEGKRLETSWAATTLGLKTQSPGRKGEGFTSRIAHICSAYIVRTDGDNQDDFDTAKANTANDPYWYGFLISYRELLDICPDIESNLTQDIDIPDTDSIALEVEALVQYGAGTDEKHHSADITELAGYVDTAISKSFYQDDAIQGGGATTYKTCMEELRSDLFETSLAGLNSTLDSTLTTDCGYSP